MAEVDVALAWEFAAGLRCPACKNTRKRGRCRCSVERLYEADAQAVAEWWEQVAPKLGGDTHKARRTRQSVQHAAASALSNAVRYAYPGKELEDGTPVRDDERAGFRSLVGLR